MECVSLDRRLEFYGGFKTSAFNGETNGFRTSVVLVKERNECLVSSETVRVRPLRWEKSKLIILKRDFFKKKISQFVHDAVYAVTKTV